MTTSNTFKDFDWDDPEALEELAKILVEPLLEQSRINRERLKAFKASIIVEPLEK